MRNTVKYLSVMLVFPFFTFGVHAETKVVVIPMFESSSDTNKLWGTGRPGTGLLAHTNPNGYCTTPQGIHYALSKTIVTWQGAAESCPAGTWVCSSSEFPTSGSCNIQTISTKKSISCDGTIAPTYSHSWLPGWLADAKDYRSGRMNNSDSFSSVNYNYVCFATRTWCCWK